MPHHPDLHRHGGLPRSTLRLWLQRQHYAQGTLWKILYTSFIRNNHVFVACRSYAKFPKGNIEEPYVCTLYAPADFVVIETGNDERAPVILGRPFLNTSGAVIYASAAKISFYIKGRKETFSFKNKVAQILEQSRHEPRKRTNRRNRNKQVWTESAKMVTTVHGGQDHRLKSPFLTKKDDPGMPSIRCSINGYNFYKTLCDTGSSVNILAAVTYQLLFGTMPLKKTYIQL